jgi:uncharacterized protein YcbX
MTGVVGRVVVLYRYPVKSMAGEALETAELGWHGIEGDRRYAFVRDGARGGFPWLTGRDIPDLVRFQPVADGDGVPRVRLPEGREMSLDDPELAADLSRRHRAPVRLLKLDRGTFDAAPVSIISTATLAALGRVAGLALEPARFRPNLLVETAEARAEDAWVGRVLEIGEGAAACRVHVNKRDGRCVMVTLDPATAAAAPAVLKAVVDTSDGYAGVYASVVQCGTLAAGAPIRLLPAVGG